MKTHQFTFVILVSFVFGLNLPCFAEQKTDTTQIQYLRFSTSVNQNNVNNIQLNEIKAFSKSENVAQGMLVSADSYGWDTNISAVVDDNIYSQWNSNDYYSLAYPNGMQYGPDALHPHFIVVDLGSNYNLQSLKLDINGGGWWSFNYTFDFLVSSDSTNWSLVDHKYNTHGVYTYTNIPIQNVRYIKYACYYSSDNGQVNVEEIQAYYGGVNVALNKNTYVNSGGSGNSAVDGNSSSRWSSDRNDHYYFPAIPDSIPINVTVDLGKIQTIESIELSYPTGTFFTLSVSADGNNWLQIDKRFNDQYQYEYILKPAIAIASIISSITDSTATCNVSITADGGSAITARGICWSISPKPTLSDSIRSYGAGMSDFRAIVPGLVNNTVYYIRAWATNSEGTYYSKEICYLGGLMLQTAVISDITSSSVTTGGLITAMNEIEIFQRGICWGNGSSPTFENTGGTSDGSGTGEFSTRLNWLSAGTKYYARAYAYTSLGFFYGPEFSFKYQNVQYMATNGSFPNQIFTENGTMNDKLYLYSNEGNNIYFDGNIWSISSIASSAENGNPPLTGWSDGTVLSRISLQNAAVTHDKDSLKESSPDNGSFMETLNLTHNNTNGATFRGVDNEDFVQTGKAMVWNLPAGLTARVVRTNNLSLTLSLTGQAIAHAPANNVSNVKVMLLPQAFTDGSTALTTGNTTLISLSFIQQSNNTVTGTQISSGIKPFAYIRNSTLTIRNLVPHSTIRLYDGTGRMMLNKNVSESDTYQIPLKSAGMFLIQIDTNTQSWKSKLVNN